MIFFLSAFILACVVTLLIQRLAKKAGIVDRPDHELKQHSGAIPLLGGMSIFLSFWLVVWVVTSFTDLFGPNLEASKLLWIFFASIPLMIIGFLDDKYKISALLRLFISASCVLLVIFGGVGLEKITNPLGGVLYLDYWEIGSVLVFFWIMGMMYTTKILDGLDGLSTGISAIASFMIFFIANGERWHQPDVALLALIFAGACLGFLLFNFYPAKIFLGEGGSLFIGFILGILSVVAGGKIATALLVMAIPILDLARVAFVRLRNHQPIFKGDREHLHFRLVDMGFSQRRVVLFFYVVSFLFGITTLFLQSMQKLYALVFIFGLMVIFGVWLNKKKIKV